MALEYQNRYVAFVDVLGFHELVDRTTGTNPTVRLDDLVAALDIPSEVHLEDMTLGRIGDVSSPKHTLTAFSDCIAVSTEACEKGLMNLLLHVRAIAFRMLRLGFLLRGGIARGELFHREGKVVGPAFIKAYDLERKRAFYPRVILEPEVAMQGLAAEPPIDKIFRRLVRENDDGYYMVHSLWAIRMAADSETGFVGQWQTMVDEIASFLEQEDARLASSPDKLKKVRWFKEYFDWARDQS